VKGIFYLRVFNYVSNVLVRCLADQGEVYPRRPQVGKKRTNAPITPKRPLFGDSALVGAINTVVTRDRDEGHYRGGGEPLYLFVCYAYQRPDTPNPQIASGNEFLVFGLLYYNTGSDSITCGGVKSEMVRSNHFQTR